MGLLDVPLGNNAPVSVNAIVEIPRGSFMKYEYDPALGMIHLGRVLHSPSFYPVDYGLLPQTLTEIGDHLDVLIVVNGPSFPGCVMEVRPLGVLRMIDENGPDDKIIAVTSVDPYFIEIETLDDLKPHRRVLISHFFEVYKTLEDKVVEVLGWSDQESARQLISEAHARWQAAQPK